jgi:hypothetical protein
MTYANAAYLLSPKTQHKLSHKSTSVTGLRCRWMVSINLDQRSLPRIDRSNSRGSKGAEKIPSFGFELTRRGVSDPSEAESALGSFDPQRGPKS